VDADGRFTSYAEISEMSGWLPVVCEAGLVPDEDGECVPFVPPVCDAETETLVAGECVPVVVDPVCDSETETLVDGECVTSPDENASGSSVEERQRPETNESNEPAETQTSSVPDLDMDIERSAFNGRSVRFAFASFFLPMDDAIVPTEGEDIVPLDSETEDAASADDKDALVVYKWQHVDDVDSDMGRTNRALTSFNYGKFDNVINNREDVDNHDATRAKLVLTSTPETCPSNPALAPNDPACSPCPFDTSIVAGSDQCTPVKVPPTPGEPKLPPVDPNQPNQPKVPGQPDQPFRPNLPKLPPLTPGTPQVPGSPIVPNLPQVPTTPMAKRPQVEQAHRPLSQTGTTPALLGLGLLTLAAGAAVVLRNRTSA
jgi:hypothetical protein